jgi:O-methyltransferase involved in polyketide biosynthesis
MTTTTIPEITLDRRDKVSETLLVPLYLRASEAQRPDALLRDEKAVTLARQMDHDAAQLLARVDEGPRLPLFCATGV